MEHKLITGGGEHWLAFARSKIKGLRNSALRYGVQRYTMPDDAVVEVRIVGDIDYISIAGDTPGEYLTTPRSNDFPAGDGDLPFATVSVKNFPKVNVKKHIDKEAGATDWRGDLGLRLTYFNGFMARYRLDRGYEAGSGAPDVFRDGKRIKTGDIPVSGAAIIYRKYSNGSVYDKIVIASVNNGSMALYLQPNRPNDPWPMIAEYLVPEGLGIVSVSQGQTVSITAALTDPCFFSPDATKMTTILTALQQAYIYQAVRPLRATINVSGSSANATTVTAEFVLGDPYPTNYSSVFTDPDGTFGNTTTSGGFSPYPPDPEIPVGTGTTSNVNTFQNRVSIETVLAVDYDDKGTEIVLRLKERTNVDYISEAVSVAVYSGYTYPSPVDGHPVPAAKMNEETNLTSTKDDSWITTIYADETPIVENLRLNRVTITEHDVRRYVGSSGPILGLSGYVTTTTQANTYRPHFMVLCGLDARDATAMVHAVEFDGTRTTTTVENYDSASTDPSGIGTFVSYNPQYLKFDVNSWVRIYEKGAEVGTGRQVSKDSVSGGSPFDADTRVNRLPILPLNTTYDSWWASRRAREKVFSYYPSAEELLLSDGPTSVVGGELVTHVPAESKGDFSAWSGAAKNGKINDKIADLFPLGQKVSFRFAPVRVLTSIKELMK